MINIFILGNWYDTKMHRCLHHCTGIMMDVLYANAMA